MQQSRVYVGMILILIFGEVLGLYGYVAGRLDRGRGQANARQSNCWPNLKLQDVGLSDQGFPRLL